jgi:hypothetical protein
MLKGLVVKTFSAVAVPRNAVLLHGGGFVIDGMGGVFLGRSGAGKSTAVTLVRPDQLLSDDIVLVTGLGASSRAHASPMGRATGGPGSAQLRALVIVRQSDHFSILRLSEREAIAKTAWAQLDIIAAAFESVRSRCFSNLNHLVESVPCYEMGFSLDGVDRDAIRRVLTDPLPLP